VSIGVSVEVQSEFFEKRRGFEDSANGIRYFFVYDMSCKCKTNSLRGVSSCMGKLRSSFWMRG